MIARWKIKVRGYRTFEFIGTERDAEAMRVSKASWECGRADKAMLGPATEEELARYAREADRENMGYCPEQPEVDA